MADIHAISKNAVDVWLIHKDAKTGELLGPIVRADIPTTVTHAMVIDGQWHECQGPNHVSNINASLPNA